MEHERPEPSRATWEDTVAASPRRDADFDTHSGIPVEGAYGPESGPFPGQWPYVRGPYASMYRSKLWTMRMFAGFGTAPDTNARFKDILANGGDGLSTAFDLRSEERRVGKECRCRWWA